MLTRRSVLWGLFAAPIVVRAGLIMPVKALPSQATLLETVLTETAKYGKVLDPFAEQFRREVIAQFQSRQSLLRGVA